jgi:hypothetical protein
MDIVLNRYYCCRVPFIWSSPTQLFRAALAARLIGGAEKCAHNFENISPDLELNSSTTRQHRQFQQ